MKNSSIKFQNKKSTMAIWLQKFIMTLLFTICLIFVGFTRWFDQPFLGLDRLYWVSIIVIVWLLVVIFQNARQPCYIYFEDAEDRLILRYYPLKIINQKKNSIEIPKKAFLRYETEKFFFGKFEKLIIYQKFNKDIGKYKPISLSAVSKSDIMKIKTILNQYTTQK